MAAVSLGLSVVLTEETDWIGGQLTAQAVPPDEHPWIEQFGCTRRYREFRNRIRGFYRQNLPLIPSALADPHLNPGGGWVSRLCHEPRIAWAVLNQMLLGHGEGPRVFLNCRAIEASTDGDLVKAVKFERQGEEFWIESAYVLDATELGDLLPLTSTEFVIGAESQAETGEEHAPEVAAPGNQQAITWVFAMAHDPSSQRTIDRPAHYDRWSTYRPPFWPGPLLGEWDLKPQTCEPRNIGILSDNPWNFFTYRQIVDPSKFDAGYAEHAVTIVNWPLNDYFLEPLVGQDGKAPVDVGAGLEDARELSRCLLYWMQTELGLTGLYMQGDTVGTSDGFAKYPYIRESRRLRARFTVVEEHVSAASRPGQDLGEEFADSVGVGAYRIDLHPSTGGDNYIDTSSLPFQIPFGSLVPIRMRNLLAAAKNLGVTHITNGCYRLHPVEWNIGEAAGLAAGFCILNGVEPGDVYESPELLKSFQRLCDSQGIEREWPRVHAL
jgi:hypothetical protein